MPTSINSRTVACVLVAIVVQAGLYYYFTRRTILLVGVLSARGNFERRAVARETWLSGTPRVKSFFVVGQQPCRVPPEDRVDPYVCARWEPNVTAITENLEFYATTAKTRDCFPRRRTLYTGFSFQVRHTILISRLGVLADILSGTTGVTVALINAVTREIVRKTVISSENGKEEDGYYYRNVDRVVLHRYFEGIINLSGEIISETCSSTLAWNNLSNLLSYKRLYVDHEESRSVGWFPEAVSGVGVRFVISDALPSLLDHVDDAEMRQAAWDERVDDEQMRLEAEARRYGDVALVPVVDVYRSLAAKLLAFFGAILERSVEFDFLYKTDDDTVANLEAIRDHVPTTRQNVWWSSFRENWPVERYGKWAEASYRASSYPAFACGSGYVLSRNLVLWLARNKNSLHPYQGEDVSMGIWLAAVAPTLIHDDHNWTCGYPCHEGVPSPFNRAQLSPAEIKKVWTNFKRTGKLC
ncbi:UDP-GalNAc:beta-1,3-N-acetylgalactosaminyltransferase 2 [Ixodes scapularis]|uniref:UDP-GalNAc:beta-1, 3-N-acetylgalactosaminyltransferase 2 n=1 Tax=Ixodes scapularis TaxID=6945 RepID=UPI001C383AE1|nr:UDP-GalNAc:beta-1,3-N-acetylgalactosaminyltransferase 2 [Ixodes scapularis]